MNYLIGAFKYPCIVTVKFADRKTRKEASIKKENGQTVMVPLFENHETIAGEVSIDPLQGKKVEHIGVKIELLGQIELYFDRGRFYDFTSLVRELDVPGEIYEKKSYPFEFSTVEMPYESYNGVNVRLRYILRLTISRNYVPNIVVQQDFWVHNYTVVPTVNNSIKMEVGIEDCLHIEFEYNKSKYHLKDVIIGKIYFLLVRIKIKNMELEIRRRESTGLGPNTYVETETLAKFELMDGAPARGESIPSRLFLSPYELTPTYRNINNKYSVNTSSILFLLMKKTEGISSSMKSPSIVFKKLEENKLEFLEKKLFCSKISDLLLHKKNVDFVNLGKLEPFFPLEEHCVFCVSVHIGKLLDLISFCTLCLSWRLRCL